MLEAAALYALFLVLTAAIYLTVALTTPRYEGRGVPMAGLSATSAALLIGILKLCLM